MRIDLEGKPRPAAVRLILRFVKWQAGFLPGPILMLSYRPDFFSSSQRAYMMRGMRGKKWSKGESELLAAFISSLNACHF